MYIYIYIQCIHTNKKKLLEEERKKTPRKKETLKERKWKKTEQELKGN